MLETTGKNIEAKLSEKENAIQSLRERDNHNADAISSLSDMILEMRKKIEVLEKKQENSISRHIV